MMKFGIERLLADRVLQKPLAGRRVALLAHPASVAAGLTHSLDAIASLPDIKLTAAFGPQHGLRGDKQDNMVESDDYTDPAPAATFTHLDATTNLSREELLRIVAE